MSEILHGDALTILRERFADESVQCCVTSPPYWGLRDYKTGMWEGGEEQCSHRVGGQVKQTRAPYECGTGQRPGVDASTCLDCGAVRVDQQIGLERTPEEYVSKMVEVFREVRRVLKNDGTLWLNLGDSYAGSWGNYHPNSPPGKHGQRLKEAARWNRPAYQSQEFLPPTANIKGLKPKDLCMIPARVALALQADGWYLRCDVIWSKPNPMPESVTDRPTKAHEYLFLLAKSERYYYDAEAIAEPASRAEWAYETATTPGNGDRNDGGCTQRKFKALPDTQANIRTTRDKQRGHSRRHDGFNDRWDAMEKTEQCSGMRNKRSVWEIATAPYPEAHFATFPPKLIEPCILAGCPAGGLVLDPFCGSGTTLMVAKQLGRRGVGIELNADYITMAEARCRQESLML